MVVEFKQGHNNSKHVDETKLDETESKLFILFLESEITRHKKEIKTCHEMTLIYAETDVLRIAYESSMTGHLEDINATQKTIDYLKEKWRNDNGKSE
jgi:hypothetical protein